MRAAEAESGLHNANGNSRRTVRLLVADIAGVRYGVPESGVIELLSAVATTRLPRAPSIVEGIANIHGRVVPVLDVRARFALPPKEVAPGDHLVVCQAGPRRVAIRVDRALDLVAVPADSVEDSRAVVVGGGPLFGVAKLPDGLISIHDVAAFLSQAEAEALDAALDATHGVTQ